MPNPNPNPNPNPKLLKSRPSHGVVVNDNTIYEGSHIACTLYCIDHGYLVHKGRGKHKLTKGVHIRGISPIQERSKGDQPNEEDASTKDVLDDPLVQTSKNSNPGDS